MEILTRIEYQSADTACLTVMVGRRRIGKTSLLLRSSVENKMLYLFVSRNSEAVLCRQFQEQASEVLGLQIYGTISRVAEVKRNSKKISLQTLAIKTASIQKQLAKYEVSLKALSLNDM